VTEISESGSTTILDRVRDLLHPRTQAATDLRVAVGERAALVTVEHPVCDLAGLVHRPQGDADALQSAIDRVDSVATVAGWATTADSRLQRAVGIATLNALSVPDLDWRVGDPMAALTADVDVVATVGLFRPAFRKFDDVTVRVVERDQSLSVDPPPGVTVELYPPSASATAFADADVCFLTGSTLVYGGIERYLDALSVAGVAPVVLVGATASHLPGPAFDAGVDVVAGARVDEPDAVRERVLAGDCGTDLHDHGVQKVFVASGGQLPGLDLG
jgi:uncharacterized protein (DUF4213/DUF364 family)